jgi:hypothetical protein
MNIQILLTHNFKVCRQWAGGCNKLGNFEPNDLSGSDILILVIHAVYYWRRDNDKSKTTNKKEIEFWDTRPTA